MITRINYTSFRKNAGIAALAGTLALVVVGCSTGLRPFGDGTAPPPPPTRPPLTSAPITPTPAPVATQAPAASPTTNPTPKSVSLASFRKHILGAYRDLKPLKREMKRAANSSDLAAIVEAVANVRRWADGEVAWANAREARPCFSALYEAWRQTVVVIQEAFVVFEEAIDSRDSAGLRRALALMDEADAIYEPGDADMAETCRR